MNPPYSTVSQSLKSTSTIKDDSTHTTFSTIKPDPKEPINRITTHSDGTPRRRKKSRTKSRNHRNFSRTTSTPSVNTILTSDTCLQDTKTQQHTRTRTRRRRTHPRPTATRSISSRTKSISASSRTHTRSSSSPPPYSLHPPSSSSHRRKKHRRSTSSMSQALARLDDLGALLFFRLPLYLGRRKTIYILDDVGIWGLCRPLRGLGSLWERLEERFWTWKDWR